MPYDECKDEVMGLDFNRKEKGACPHQDEFFVETIFNQYANYYVKLVVSSPHLRKRGPQGQGPSELSHFPNVLQALLNSSHIWCKIIGGRR